MTWRLIEFKSSYPRVRNYSGGLPLGFDAAEHVRPEQDRVAEADRLLSELAEYDRRTIAHDHDPHAAIRRRSERAIDRARVGSQWWRDSYSR